MPLSSAPTRFVHPEPPARRHERARVLPVFLPFAGCPGRCVFCNQNAQTGTAPEPLANALDRLAKTLAALAAQPVDPSRPCELAFYGGTFTALPEPWPRRFLEAAAPQLRTGRLNRIRCSTRPDAVTPTLLAELKALGLGLVELGVQSFDDAALAESRRGYDGATARAACRMVQDAGLSLGIQLMPGLPGQTPEAFRADIAATAALAPELARLYPCLVLADTPLAGLWQSGAYAPWPLTGTVDELARALLTLWAAGIPAARLGLAEQKGLTVLAGPRHPALGQMARSRALVLHVRERLVALPAPVATLFVPRRFQGEVLGQKNALAAEYAALGLTVELWDETEFALDSVDPFRRTPG